MEPRVFICHSSADASTAKAICAHLEQRGIACWIAPRDPVPGIPYAAQIVSAIAASPIVLLVLSSRANESRAVLNEIELAANRGKIVLPVRIEDVQPSPNLEFYVRSIHWFDATARPLRSALSELAHDVRTLLPELHDSADGAAAEPRRPAPPRPSNLPLQVTSFVGRERDIAEIKRLARTSRLITLVGAGGAGKTRAAIQTATELINQFADGVRFVELAPISDGSLVAATIARTLNVREETDRAMLDTLVDQLASRNLLLVLDNCEHVIEQVREVAAALMRHCPGTRILATSRENLNVAGEHVFRLPSLAVPPPDATLKPRTVMRYGAVALFVDRARAADGRFALTPANAPFVAEICRRLDGIPLAVELAAARISVLSPQQLAQKLDERFRLLTGGDRSALPRHRTMRALIDWSYDLLSESERALFREVSIFTDGFTLSGASTVCRDEGRDELEVLDLLASLVGKSLIQTDPGSEDRYRLLESTRQYAREKLADCGEVELCASRHLKYLTQVFRKAGDAYETTMAGAALSGLVIELEDARSALTWGIEHALRDAVDLFLATRLWAYLGLHREGIERAEQLLGRLDDDPARRARLYERIALCAGGIGSSASSRDAAEHALRYARASNDAGILADCLLRYADVIAHAGRFDDALKALEEIGDTEALSPRRKLQSFHTRALIGTIRGDLDAAARSWAQVRDLYASVGNEIGVVSAALGLAEIEHAQGATTAAIATATSALSRAEELSDRSMRAQLTLNLAGYLSAEGNVAQAHRAAARALAFYASSDPEGAFTAVALEHLALCLAIEGELRTAAVLEGYAGQTFARLGFEREHTERTSHARLMDLLSSNVATAELTELFARGREVQSLDALAKAAPYDAAFT